MIRPILATILFLAVALAACNAPSSTPPTPAPTLAPTPFPSPTALPTSTILPTATTLPVATAMPVATTAHIPVVERSPIPRSQLQIGQPLSSGLSLPDVVETALLSVVEIQAPDGNTGTGFIVTADGQVVTNNHVVASGDQVNLRLVSGTQYAARVTGRHSTLDLAYLEIVGVNGGLTPIALGDSNALRVGEGVIVIGFPLGANLGQDPTVSQGIVSAIRAGVLQTDAPINPGNSGGPMLDHAGNVVGVVSSRAETTDDGRAVSGIGFAIPINAAVAGLAGVQAAPVPSGTAVPTPIPTAVPPIPPTIDLQATKAAIDAENARLQTRTAVEQENARAAQEAREYARSVEATRVANLPTATPVPTPTPEPTPTPLPTATPHPRLYCEEWEAMVLEWIYRGNNYYENQNQARFYPHPDVPDHPNLSARAAHGLCITIFPDGRLYVGWNGGGLHIGTGEAQLLPGTYKYQSDNGDDRISARYCYLQHEMDGDYHQIDPEYGQPFQFTFHTYHGRVNLGGACSGFLYRIGS